MPQNEPPVARYPRDFRGYGPNRPDAAWPGGAKIAVSVVLNYEEGGENNILHGDATSEAFLSDIAGAAPWPGARHWNMESLYDYGARAGFWRLHRLFTGMEIPVTVFGVATALARNPEQVAAMVAAGWEIASHGLKWVDHRDMPAAVEAAQIAAAIRLHTEVTGTPPRGWYTGRCSVNTVDLVAATGQFDWISDAYDDDLPYWREVGGRDQLIIPYTLEANDMRFATAPGYTDGAQFFQYLKDSFDVLYAEGQGGHAAMFSIGLHCRLIGRPGKIAGLMRFLDYAKSHNDVWFPTRGDIARQWIKTHPNNRLARPSQATREEFITQDNEGAIKAQAMLDQYGGSQIVHGHTPIPCVTKLSASRVIAPFIYADGLCINIDAGMYMGSQGFIHELPSATPITSDEPILLQLPETYTIQIPESVSGSRFKV